MADNDPRLAQFVERTWMHGILLRWMRYPAPRPEWDHDHCVGCHAVIAAYEAPGTTIFHEAYATRSDYRDGTEFDWICPRCFVDFKDAMAWREAGEDQP